MFNVYYIYVLTLKIIDVKNRLHLVKVLILEWKPTTWTYSIINQNVNMQMGKKSKYDCKLKSKGTMFILSVFSIFEKDSLVPLSGN